MIYLRQAIFLLENRECFFKSYYPLINLEETNWLLLFKDPFFEPQGAPRNDNN
jgi:hypothetical protein